MSFNITVRLLNSAKISFNITVSLLNSVKISFNITVSLLNSAIALVSLHPELFIPRRKATGNIEIVFVRLSFRPSIRPSFRPTFLSGAYLKKYLRYQLESS
jgi:hypothetical protein